MIDASLAPLLPASISARVKALRVTNGRAMAVLDASGLDGDGRGNLEESVRTALRGADGVESVHIAMSADRARRRLIAVGSGKGGVGKSTLTANLAVALARRGMKVGVVDADIYGPSQPTLLDCANVKPAARDDKMIPIASRHGVRVLSMGHLIAPGKAIAWRGPMVGNALAQLLDAHWDEEELLLVDLPPGTGDVQLTMLQRFRPDGAILVSTPQDLALIDAIRAGQMFDMGEIPIVGLVENMAGYACPHCGEHSDPFGKGGIEAAAAKLELPFLGRIPLSVAVREASDGGNPPAAGEGEGAAAFAGIAGQLQDWLAEAAQ